MYALRNLESLLFLSFFNTLQNSNMKQKTSICWIMWILPTYQASRFPQLPQKLARRTFHLLSDHSNSYVKAQLVIPRRCIQKMCLSSKPVATVYHLQYRNTIILRDYRLHFMVRPVLLPVEYAIEGRICQASAYSPNIPRRFTHGHLQTNEWWKNKTHKAAQKSKRLIICLVSGCASEPRRVVGFSAKSSECKTEGGREG